MSKYSIPLKQSVIQAFLERGRGVRHLAERFQLEPALHTPNP
ncbi:hypothetical protein [Pseudomonas fulva]|nr:hypothetical protein [Pseudomonas fulva]